MFCPYNTYVLLLRKEDDYETDYEKNVCNCFSVNIVDDFGSFSVCNAD